MMLIETATWMSYHIVTSCLMHPQWLPHILNALWTKNFRSIQHWSILPLSCSHLHHICAAPPNCNINTSSHACTKYLELDYHIHPWKCEKTIEFLDVPTAITQVYLLQAFSSSQKHLRCLQGKIKEITHLRTFYTVVHWDRIVFSTGRN